MSEDLTNGFNPEKDQSRGSVLTNRYAENAYVTWTPPNLTFTLPAVDIAMGGTQNPTTLRGFACDRPIFTAEGVQRIRVHYEAEREKATVDSGKYVTTGWYIPKLHRLVPVVSYEVFISHREGFVPTILLIPVDSSVTSDKKPIDDLVPILIDPNPFKIYLQQVVGILVAHGTDDTISNQILEAIEYIDRHTLPRTGNVLASLIRLRSNKENAEERNKKRAHKIRRS